MRHLQDSKHEINKPHSCSIQTPRENLPPMEWNNLEQESWDGKNIKFTLDEQRNVVSKKANVSAVGQTGLPMTTKDTRIRNTSEIKGCHPLFQGPQCWRPGEGATVAQGCEVNINIGRKPRHPLMAASRSRRQDPMVSSSVLAYLSTHPLFLQCQAYRICRVRVSPVTQSGVN